MKNIRNIFKKNHIIITALEIMIVIAGYLSFTNRDVPKDDSILAAGDNNQSTQVNGFEMVTDTTGGTDATTGDTTGDATTDDTTGDTTGNTDVNATGTDDTDTEADELGDISDEDLLAVTDNGELNLEDGVPGEAILASTVIDASYFISSKLDREQVRAKNKATLMEIINSPEISAEAKQAAIDQMIKLTETAEKEGAAEILLEAKGFDGSIVYIVDDKVNVVVNAKNLTDQQLAIIEDVVKSQTGMSVENIHINTVVLEE